MVPYVLSRFHSFMYSLENVRALHTKCFICHGLLDNVVPATQPRALLARCTTARKERLTLPGMAHALTASAMERTVARVARLRAPATPAVAPPTHASMANVSLNARTRESESVMMYE